MSGVSLTPDAVRKSSMTAGGGHTSVIVPTLSADFERSLSPNRQIGMTL